jgi:hypothetical protein
VLGRLELGAAGVEDPEAGGRVDDDALHRHQPLGVGVGAVVVELLRRERDRLPILDLRQGEPDLVAPLGVADEGPPARARR